MRVAAVQLNSTDEKAANLASADRHIRAAAAEGATLIVLPEKWNVIGGKDKLLAGAEPLDGPAISWAKAIAAELSIDLIAGSVSERRQGAQRLSNTCVHVRPDGTMSALYRKIHMFDVEVDGKLYHESEIEEQGSEIVTSASGSGLQLGLAICYDLRFPELFRILALRGAQLITLPSAFTLRTSRDHWELLIRARAIENQVFLIAANQSGKHPDGYESGGRSMIVDAWGNVLASLGEQEEGHIVAKIDLESQREIRRKLPSLANRRPEVYRWPQGEEATQEVCA
jgi:deaminated glutathione amidase